MLTPLIDRRRHGHLGGLAKILTGWKLSLTAQILHSRSVAGPGKGFPTGYWRKHRRKTVRELEGTAHRGAYILVKKEETPLTQKEIHEWEPMPEIARREMRTQRPEQRTLGGSSPSSFQEKADFQPS